MIFNINFGVVIYFDKDLQFVFFLKKGKYKKFCNMLILYYIKLVFIMVFLIKIIMVVYFMLMIMLSLFK